MPNKKVQIRTIEIRDQHILADALLDYGLSGAHDPLDSLMALEFANYIHNTPDDIVLKVVTNEE
jgi:hypothetical protein